MNEIPLLNAKVETTYRHKETGELFKERKDWEAKGYKNEEMAQDVNVIMPPLDLFAKNKVKGDIMNEEISMRESIEAGAPDIKYNQGDIRMANQAIGGGEGKEIAAEIWSQMEPEQKMQFQSFDAFFKSGIWKQILQQLQQDQSGIKSQAPEMSMSENVNVAEQMPGGGIADVDVREKVAMAANGGLMGLYNRGM